MISKEVNKIKTGITGFDHVTNGGLPEGRTTLISGTAGSAKTVLACQFLAEGIRKYDQPGVFVTFEESPKDIRENMKSLNWDIEKWEKEGKWAFVDSSPEEGSEQVTAGEYDLGGLISRIEFAIKKVNAKRLSMDSLGAIFNQLPDDKIVRTELFRISAALKNLKVTSIMTAERTEEYGSIARFGVEEFVTDNVIILRNVLEAEKRRRTIEILKFRGTTHKKGEYPFSIVTDEGIVIIPLSAIELKQKSSNIRVSSGNKGLDEMCGGGFFRDSIVLVSGATGNGKTLMVTEFLGKGFSKNERSLLFAFEESKQQLTRNAIGWGIDFDTMEKEKTLRIECLYPEVMGLEDHLINMKRIIDEFKPKRVAVDSLSALERVSTIKGFREFVIGLTSFIKQKEIVGLFTSTTPELMGGTSITETHISTITDSIILLRYVELFGQMRRGITVLKMRGSFHEKQIREYSIDGEGMHIGNQFKNVSGIFTGNLHYGEQNEVSKIETLFKE